MRVLTFASDSVARGGSRVATTVIVSIGSRVATTVIVSIVAVSIVVVSIWWIVTVGD